MENRLAYIINDINRRVDVAKTLQPRKLYSQDKLNKLAKEYSKKN